MLIDVEGLLEALQDSKVLIQLGLELGDLALKLSYGGLLGLFLGLLGCLELLGLDLDLELVLPDDLLELNDRLEDLTVFL